MNNFYYKKDRLNQLRGFCALVQEGTIVKAGEKIGVENATISKQIKALERDLKVSLFIKNKIRDRLVLSEEGKKFYERAISIVQETESLYKEFSKDVEDGKNNTLRIVSRDIIIEKMLPFIVEFKKKNPK
ncbi:MAG: LysR family transcriptional regulator, partial [Rickettsiales bacterium]|nr:LysR family transcriptional regulator [Rickettsiales bacterium]